jgi:hypothetical protein
MGGADANTHLDVGAVDDERLQDRPIGACDLLSDRSPLGRAGQRSRVGRGARVAPVHRQHTEVRQQDHHSPSDEHDDRVERRQLASI